MRPSQEELAEDTMAYVLPSPMFDPRERDGYVYVAGRAVDWVVRVRRLDIDAMRAEARERCTRRLECWLGWSSPAAGDDLLAAGFVPDETPTLTGMTCAEAPPRTPHVEARLAEPDEVVAIERAVWGNEPEPPVTSSAIHHFAAVLNGRCVGFGRAVDLERGVALMGGAVLPEARGRGAYRALVRARWDHAVARGTPLLVVQAGEQSAPVLDGLGFRRHGELRLFVDRL